jgi:hypothetical protein
MDTTDEKPQSRNWVWPLTTFFLALAVRLIVLFELEANDPSFYFPQVDSRWHPLYPLILGLLYSFSGTSILFAKIFWMIVSALSCVLIYRVAARVLDRGAARIAGIIMAFYGTMIFFDSQFLFPVLIVFLSLAAVLFLLKYSDSENPVYLYLSALTFGFSGITRPNILAVVPFVLLWCLIYSAKSKSLRYRLVHAVVFLMLLIIPILPTAIHNYRVSQEFIPISSQGGVNLYIGNNPTADGLVVSMPEFPPGKWVAWNEFIELTDSIAEQETGKQLKPGEISSFWISKSLSWVKSIQETLCILRGVRSAQQLANLLLQIVLDSTLFSNTRYRNQVPIRAHNATRPGGDSYDKKQMEADAPDSFNDLDIRSFCNNLLRQRTLQTPDRTLRHRIRSRGIESWVVRDQIGEGARFACSRARGRVLFVTAQSESVLYR